MPDTQQKISPRSFEANTLDKFKGVNSSGAAPTGIAFNGYGGDEKEAQLLKNLNVTPEGYLEKRLGLGLFATLPSNAGHARYVGQLSNLGLRKIWLYFSDGNSLWRVDDQGGGIAEIKMETTGFVLGGIQAVVQVGNPGNQYNGIGVSHINGVIGMYGVKPESTSAWLSGSPRGDRCLMFKNRGWVINSREYGTAGNETRLYFSGVSNLGDWTAGGAAGGGNFQIDVADGDNLSGMIIYNDNIILFKTKKTYSFTADGDPSNWTYRVISDRVGCVAHASIRSIAGFLYFLSADGVYKTDGTTYQLISEPVHELLQGMHNYWDPIGTNDNISAVYYDNKYILFVSKDGNPTDQALVYDIPTEQWTVWDFDNARTGITVLGAVRLGDRSIDKIVVGSWSQRRIWVMDSGYQDNGVDTTCIWQSRRQDFGDMINKKRNHMVAATVSHTNHDPQELSVRGNLVPSTAAADTFVGNSVNGQLYSFSRAGQITGVSFYSPGLTDGKTFEIAIWSTDGVTRHRVKTAIPPGTPTLTWHTIRFDSPFQVVVGTTYMIAVGYPSASGNKVLAYSLETQSTIKYGPISCMSGGNIHYKDLVVTGYPNVTEASAKTACLTPLFKEDVPVPVTTGYGPELGVRDDLNVTHEQYSGAAVGGQLYAFSALGAIFGVEFFTPQHSGSAGQIYQISVWSENGSVLHRQYTGPLLDPGVGWHKYYFDTPFPVAVTTPIMTNYMISVGFPVTGTDVRGYAHVAQTSVINGPMILNSGDRLWYTDGSSTGFPMTAAGGQANNVTKLGPLFAPYDYTGVVIETKADDTTTVTTTLPAAKLSDRLIKTKGAGYGRYFQTKLSYLGNGPFNLYGITWMNETRGIQPNAGPNRNA